MYLDLCSRVQGGKIFDISKLFTMGQGPLNNKGNMNIYFHSKVLFTNNTLALDFLKKILLKDINYPTSSEGHRIIHVSYLETRQNYKWLRYHIFGVSILLILTSLRSVQVRQGVDFVFPRHKKSNDDNNNPHQNLPQGSMLQI